jgi:LEA14-like dessication related protein
MIVKTERVRHRPGRRVASQASLRLLFALLTLCNFVSVGQAAGTRQVETEKRPDLEVKAVAVKGVNLANQTAEAVFSVAIKNPGPAFRLQDLAYRLTINDYAIAEGAYEKEVEVAARGETVVELPLTFDLTKVPGVAWNAAKDSFTLRYELETEFTVPLFAALKHTQKASFKGDFPIPDALPSLPVKLKEKLFGKP